MTNKYPKKHLLPPESGPLPQGLNIKYNTVTTVKQSGEKINGRYRQSTSKRSRKEFNVPGEEEVQEQVIEEVTEEQQCS
jgi:hypothetical protein